MATSNAVNLKDQGVAYVSSAGAFSGIDASTSGKVLTSNGTGVAPSFQTPAPGGIVTLNGDSGSATGTTVTLTGSTNGGVFTNSGSTSTLIFDHLDLPNTTNSSPTGQIRFATVKHLSNFGTDNFFIGANSGNTTLSGTQNNCFGKENGLALTSGYNNTFVGHQSGKDCTTGFNNNSIGLTSLNKLTTGNYNSATGYNSLANITTGIYNTAVGNSSGSNYTSSESSNILIGSQGTLGESNVMRLGTQGSGNGQVNKAYVAGVVGVTTSNSQMVTIDSTTGQMGVATIPTGGTIPFTEITTATQSCSVNNGYITSRGGGVVYTLPASGAIGDVVRFVGKTGIATITPNTGQQICIGGSSGLTGATGTATANNLGDCLDLVCITAGASAVWRANGIVGNWTLVTS